MRDVMLIVDGTKGREVAMLNYEFQGYERKTLKDYSIKDNGDSFQLVLEFDDETKREFKEIVDVDLEIGNPDENLKAKIWFQEKGMKESHPKIFFDSTY
jgi:hypothetical protein